jgi:hypothetical protein
VVGACGCAQASNINKSLSALGNVIMALADLSDGRTRHVHFRDSKLTFLLKVPWRVPRPRRKPRHADGRTAGLCLFVCAWRPSLLSCMRSLLFIL